MPLRMKAVCIAIPLAVMVQVITIGIGFVLFGENFHVPYTNIIGVATGLICFFQVEKFLKNISK